MPKLIISQLFVEKDAHTKHGKMIISVSTAFELCSSNFKRLLGCHFWASVRILSSVVITSPSNLKSGKRKKKKNTQMCFESNAN